MQVAGVVKWVCGKKCGAAVDALKRGTVALVCKADIHKAASRHNQVHGRSHAAKFPLSLTMLYLAWPSVVRPHRFLSATGVLDATQRPSTPPEIPVRLSGK
jgi:hypothetical protein